MYLDQQSTDLQKQIQKLIRMSNLSNKMLNGNQGLIKTDRFRFQRTVSRSNSPFFNNSLKKLQQLPKQITYIKPSVGQPKHNNLKSSDQQSFFNKLSKFSQRQYSKTVKTEGSILEGKQNNAEQSYQDLKIRYNLKIKECQKLQKLLKQNEWGKMQKIQSTSALKYQIISLNKTIQQLREQKKKDENYINELEWNKLKTNEIILSMKEQLICLKKQKNPQIYDNNKNMILQQDEDFTDNKIQEVQVSKNKSSRRLNFTQSY